MIKKTTLILFMLACACLRADAFPVSITDETGRWFTFMSAPKRIISAMPSNTEILYALGAQDDIVGVTGQCNYPAEAVRKKKIGDTALNYEQIASLNPDLIVMLGDAQGKDIEKLRAFGLPVFVINPHNIDELTASIRLLGKITGRQQLAGKLVKSFADEIKKISSRSRGNKRHKVFVVLWDDPLITSGRDTFIDDLVKRAGGINIGAEGTGPYPAFSFESLLKADPDDIIIAGKSYTDVERITKNQKWKQLRAVRQNRVLLIDSDIITRPSPRLVKALDLVFSLINR